LNDYETYIHRSRYARYLPEEGRRETWEESVKRLINFWEDRELLCFQDLAEVETAILNREVMPSMRSLMTAGEALDRDNVAGYNCSYLAINRVRAFDELMYILMCGTGVGFSVERRYVEKLPQVAEDFHTSETTVVVADSKIGWAKALKQMVALLYAGEIPSWDLSRVRPAGARLATFGGRASGPEPLDRLFKWLVPLFKAARGRQLTSLECHDICCMIASVVVVGGVRRSALLSLSNLTDERMRHAKDGQWWVDHQHRSYSNNSVCYTEKPDIGIFMREWQTLYESKSGERGIFSRAAAKKQAARNGRRDTDHEFGTNPCSEIILRDRQFCNLSEVVVRPEDTLDSLKNKVRLATILGTMQATLTDFRYLSAKWKENTEEEALLGVSLTGLSDRDRLTSKELEELRNVAVETNREYAGKFGIKQATAVTAIKPSGTVSQLVNSGSGIHARYSRYYIRTVRSDKKDPLSQFLIDQGIPYEDEIKYDKQGQRITGDNWVFSFPMESPVSSVVVGELSAVEQLEDWKHYSLHWCEHKPSCTVYVQEDEWLEVAAWCYYNFDLLSGISFLPHTDHVYEQAPYQPISKEQYEEAVAKMPTIQWSEFVETEDNTTGSSELACTGGACEIL
jgi:ribonucleoside-diphosphate reductase alpha chain